jgi:hypothetical protein
LGDFITPDAAENVRAATASEICASHRLFAINRARTEGGEAKSSSKLVGPGSVSGRPSPSPDAFYDPTCGILHHRQDQAQHDSDRQWCRIQGEGRGGYAAG